MKKYLPLMLILAIILGLLAVACSDSEPTPTPEVVKETVVVQETVVVEVEKEVIVTQEVEVEVEKIVEVTPEPAPYSDVPFLEAWAASGHSDAEAEAFVHWDEEDPAEVPTSCAKCHSTPGHLDFLGADGTEAGVVDNPAPIGTTIQCIACHNDVSLTKTSVTFPSGIEIMGLGDEARCMECHQGRQSTVSVNAAIEAAGVDDDAVSEDIGFQNIHYYAAAATKYGTLAKGGYEYEGKIYDANFAHVESFDTCIECHDMHSLEVQVDDCQACHEGVASVEDLQNVRMEGSLVDYDGDDDMEEGVAAELAGLQEMLYAAIQAYATEVAGVGTVYDSASHPYWFTEDGERYATWTPRMSKAAYNYQVSLKDPGNFAHGGKYIMQLLYDSIEDLNTALSEPVDLSNAHRIDHGHFAGSEEAFRHWDEDGAVPGDCSRCHSAEGLPLYIEQGVSIEQPISNGFQCATCHNDLETYSRYEPAQVEFPSGLVIMAEEAPDADTMLCMQCHQGRESTVSVNERIEGLDPDTVSDTLGFLNVHYFAAGATRFGTQAQGAYEYDSQEYNGFFEHLSAVDSCTDCHNTHALEVDIERCADCHDGVASKEDLLTIRVSEVDFDGDGDEIEGIAGEIETMHEALYVAIQAYTADEIGTGAEYNPNAYPYWFTTDGERYTTWTPRLLQAAYNYQYTAKDPGAFAHNGEYILQTLYDSIESVGGDVNDMTRPEVRTE
jgi:hypothetical protein